MIRYREPFFFVFVLRLELVARIREAFWETAIPVHARTSGIGSRFALVRNSSKNLVPKQVIDGITTLLVKNM